MNSRLVPEATAETCPFGLESAGNVGVEQPWRAWWPRYFDQNQDAKSAPWLSWTFDHGKPFEKPWLTWQRKADTKFIDKMRASEPKYEPLRHDSPVEQTQLDREAGIAAQNNSDAGRTKVLVQYYQQIEEARNQKPYVSKIPPPLSTPSARPINFTGNFKETEVIDVRGYQEQFKLDVHGFAFQKHRSGSLPPEPSHEHIRNKYIPDMSEWLRDLTGASEVFVFDYVLRSQVLNSSDIGQKQEIARRMHCDQTPRSAIGRIRLHHSDRANELLQGRCRFIYMWRAFSDPVEDWPLAMCDFRTIDRNNELVPVDVVYPHYVEESFEIKPSPAQKWYYLSKCRPDDLVLLKVFDSKTDGRAYCVPHGAFKDPRAPEHAPPRRSVELRAMVFGGRDDAE